MQKEAVKTLHSFHGFQQVTLAALVGPMELEK